ncbi:diablo IAP-binding mitochondrial protein-like isoform X1 [Branchiostoma lanceolatum]|uniref:diablo IAP-binding mitochondrial protein-like isoform X1 n=1 Tax=Branchiostoma lanceolatum TaxID=7740 RepID=UPI0034568B3A
MMLSRCLHCFRRQQSCTQLKNVVSTSMKSVFRGSGICASVGVWTGCSLSILQLARLKAAEPVYPTAKLQPPDPSTLTHEYLMRSAAALTVDSAITLLSQTTLATIHLEQEYAKIVSTLTSLLEYETLVLGNAPEEERVAQLIIQQRVELEDKRRQLQNIEVALLAVQHLIESAAEAAYQTGAEAATVAAQERLQLAQNQLELVRTESRQADSRLNQLQTQTIHKVGEMIKEAEESSNETQS